MPRFFLNIRDGETYIEDEEGSVLPDVEAACREAVLAAREILASKLRAGDTVDGQVFEITDENRVVRATFQLRDVLNLK
jgi:ribosomal protein S1